MLFHEVHKVNKLYGTLEAIENILVRNGEHLVRLGREDLMDMYKMFSSRQRNGQAFITRMLELGVKTKILGQLMDTEAFQEEGKRPEGQTAIVSDKAKKVSNLIRNEMDRRLNI